MCLSGARVRLGNWEGTDRGWSGDSAGTVAEQDVPREVCSEGHCTGEDSKTLPVLAFTKQHQWKTAPGKNTEKR